MERIDHQGIFARRKAAFPGAVQPRGANLHLELRVVQVCPHGHGCRLPCCERARSPVELGSAADYRRFLCEHRTDVYDRELMIERVARSGRDYLLASHYCLQVDCSGFRRKVRMRLGPISSGQESTATPILEQQKAKKGGLYTGISIIRAPLKKSHPCTAICGVVVPSMEVRADPRIKAITRLHGVPEFICPSAG